MLRRASFCHVAAITEAGPHLTPLVFALSGGRLWLTTSRGSVKARAWRRDARVGGLVLAGDRAVSFTGSVRTYDALDPDTWLASLAAAPALSRAAAVFTRKNARFFAGYAVDARRVPLAWTPPGRVFVEIEVDRAAVLGGDCVVSEWGAWGRGTASRERFRAVRTGADPLVGLPADVANAVGVSGRGAIALEGPDGAVVLPVGWMAQDGTLYAALPAELLELAGCPTPDARVALQVDHPSGWRAKHMIGAMIQGAGALFVLHGLGSGARSAEARIAAMGTNPHAAALIRIKAERLVWWRGWSSGTAPRP